jgi:hypothetical protein
MFLPVLAPASWLASQTPDVRAAAVVVPTVLVVGGIIAVIELVRRKRE